MLTFDREMIDQQNDPRYPRSLSSVQSCCMEDPRLYLKIVSLLVSLNLAARNDILSNRRNDKISKLIQGILGIVKPGCLEDSSLLAPNDILPNQKNYRIDKLIKGTPVPGLSSSTTLCERAQSVFKDNLVQKFASPNDHLATQNKILQN